MEENQENPEKTEAVAQPSLEAQLEAAQKEILYQRAEFDNYRKRMIREQDTAIRFANDKIIADLISVVDLFDRAQGSAKPLVSKLEGNPAQTELKNFVQGIDMTHRELINLLGRFGVELTGAPDEKFDPNRHEAITEMETTDDKVGTILQVLQRGGVLHGRLLKPARVVVGKGKTTDA